MSNFRDKFEKEMILIGMCKSCTHMEFTDHNFCPKVASYVSPNWGCRDWALSEEETFRKEIEKHKVN